MIKLIIRLLLKFIWLNSPSNIRRSYNEWKDNYTLPTMATSMQTILQFGYDHNITCNSDFGKYVRGEKIERPRFIYVTLCRLSLLLFAVRFGILTFLPNPWMKCALADPFYGTTNHKMNCLFMSLGYFMLFMFAMVIHCSELSKNWHVAKFIYEVVQDKNAVVLGNSNHMRLTWGIHLLTIFCLNISYLLLLPLYNIFFLNLPIIAYFDTESEFSI